MTDIRFVPYGEPARQAVIEAIGEFKRMDPLAPVTVAVASNYAGLSLRRWLAANPLPGASRAGIANVRFLALARVTELLGVSRLTAAGKRPLLGPFRAEAIRATVAEQPGPFADVADLRPTLQSIDASFRELSHASEADLDLVANLNARTGHMVRLFRDFRSRTFGYYDDGDLAMAAAEATAAESSALAGLGALIVHLPGRLLPAQKVFIEAVAGHQPVRVIVGVTGDAAVDQQARQMWDSEQEGSLSDKPLGTEVVSVADPEEEVRETVRRINARLKRGVPLHQMAIVYRNDVPYRLVATEQLSAAGLPWNGPATKTLAQTMAGRTLLGFLELQREQFSREAMTEWLGGAPILDPANGAPAPGHRWIGLARSAHVTKGADQWETRLSAHADALMAERRRLFHGDDEPELHTPQIDADLEAIDGLKAFARDVQKQMAAREGSSWAALSSWAHAALERYLHVQADWPDDEVEALESVQETLGQLGALDTFAGRLSVGDFRAAVEQVLERPAGRTGNFGEGIFLGRDQDVAGLDLDTVFVLGMSEGAFPPTQREDPLIRDDERAAIGLHRASHRALEERRRYLAALASARHRVLLFPRADLRGQRARMPSPWLLETASALAGQRIYASDLEKPGQTWIDAPPSFESSVLGDGEPASEQEFDARSLRRWRLGNGDPERHHLVLDDPALAAGFALQRGREEPFTRWSGRLPHSAARSPFGGKPLSATALQDWATCPFRYFAGRVLKVDAPEEDEDELVVSPLKRGSLIHDVLERFFDAVRVRSVPTTPWSEDERDELARCANGVLDAAERMGGVGHPFLWQAERARISADLQAFLDADEEHRRRFNTVQTSAELAFGFEGTPELEIEVRPGKTARLRGRIDRLDEDPDGGLLVVDYKTGGVRPSQKDLDRDPVVAGKYLQLPIYAAAARSARGAEDVQSYYWFVTEKEKFKQVGYEVNGQRSERFIEVLGVIGDGIEEGVFPANPGAMEQKTWANCGYCAYDRLCPSTRQESWRRASGSADVQSYVALEQYGATDD